MISPTGTTEDLATLTSTDGGLEYGGGDRLARETEMFCNKLNIKNIFYLIQKCAF